MYLFLQIKKKKIADLWSFKDQTFQIRQDPLPVPRWGNFTLQQPKQQFKEAWSNEEE